MSARFIQCDGGKWINLNMVAEAGIRREGDNRPFVFRDAECREIGRINRQNFDFEDFTAQVVPATPDAVAIRLSANSDNAGDRPNGVLVETAKIIAWRIREYGNEPVFLEDEYDGEIVLIQQPDGRLIEQYSATYENVEEAKDAALRRFQNDWDSLESKKKSERAMRGLPADALPW